MIATAFGTGRVVYSILWFPVLRRDLADDLGGHSGSRCGEPRRSLTTSIGTRSLSNGEGI
jgi:hypothetical protein